MIDETRRPANIGIHEWLMHLMEPRQRPHWRQATGDQSPMAAWVEFEREQLARATSKRQRIQILTYVSEMKHADQFWRRILASKIDALFFTDGDRDYDENDDHRRRCQQLADAKRRAGYQLHSAGRECTDPTDATDDCT